MPTLPHTSKSKHIAFQKTHTNTLNMAKGKHKKSRVSAGKAATAARGLEPAGPAWAAIMEQTVAGALTALPNANRPARAVPPTTQPAAAAGRPKRAAAARRVTEDASDSDGLSDDEEGEVGV